MMSDGSNSDILAFGGFLEYLRQRGFRIGVDHHLRLHDLLNRASEHSAPQDLRTLLGPIFATDKNQQEQFYQAFDAYFSIFKPFLDSAPPRVVQESHLPIKLKKKTPLSERIWIYVLASILSLLTIFGTWLLLTGKNRTAQPAPVSSQPDTESDTTETPRASTNVVTTPSPTPSVSSQPISQSSSLSERYGKALRGTATGAPLIIFLFYELFTYKRRKLILQKQRNKKPPLLWPIQVGRASPKLYDSATFQAATRLMRKRQADEFYRMDVEATVAATVESLGYPSFRFTLGSRPPEYLLLIERGSFRDHQASLFDELKKALETEGIHVTRYFYDSDPRVCCDESGKNCLSLVELHSRTASHRLIMIGTGDHLLNPVSGKSESWTSLLAEWQDRAILTPASPGQWGFRELSLSTQFIVLPATTDGLLALIDCFDSTATREVSSWKGNEKTGLLPPLSNNPNLKKDLRAYLGDDAFRWLCACAVYPELQWDLTLYLGNLPVMGENLIREDHLLRMVRLPWFREGSLPDDIRWQLICELDHEMQHGIRSAIVELLERHPPPEESYAADTHRLNLVVQRWLSRSDRQARRAMLETIERTPRNQINQDHTLLRFLESDPGSALNLVLPNKLRKLFYRDGIPPLGIRSGVRLFITMVIMASIWFATIQTTAPVISSSTPTATPVPGSTTNSPTKAWVKYLEMTNDSRKDFVAMEAQHVAQLIGNREGFAFSPEVVQQIKVWVDAYSRRLNSPRPAGGCNMRHDLRTLLTRASQHAPLISKSFYEKGLSPQVGLYLAMIESEYCSCLSSGTGAKGMFQFVGTTARRYGVPDVSQPSTDPRFDDRCKVDIMAPIAAQYMKDLVAMYGTGPLSVPLAIASYNAGEDGLSSDLVNAMDAARNSDNPERSFWTMVANADQLSSQFQRENIKYVPKFFAAAIVGENPQVFGVDTAPLSSYTTEQTNLANGSTADASNAANTDATELSVVQKYAAKLLSSISNDTSPFLTEQSLTAINAQVQQYQNSPSVSEELRVIRQALPQISAAAKRSSIRTALAVYATMARIHKDGGWGDPAQVAQQICPQLAKMRVIFGDELANDSLLSVAALGEGPELQIRISRLANRVNESVSTIRSIWYLHDHKVISEETYEFVLKFIALGVISQDPQQFGIAAEPLTF